MYNRRRAAVARAAHPRRRRLRRLAGRRLGGHWRCEGSALRAQVLTAPAIEQPLADPVRTVLVKRRVSCRQWKVVKRFNPDHDGSFRVRLKAPREGEAASTA